MKLNVSPDGFAVETTQGDADLARHLHGLTENTLGIATHLKHPINEGVEERACHRCGDEKPCRPIAVANDDGVPVAAPVCAGCQREYVHARVNQAVRESQADPDPEPPAVDDEGGDA